MLIIASAGVQKDKSLRKIKLRLFKLHCTTEEVLKTENISKKIKNEKSNASMSGVALPCENDIAIDHIFWSPSPTFFWTPTPHPDQFSGWIGQFWEKNVVVIFSCPQQLNRWPCHWLSQSLTFTFDITEWPERLVTFETFDQSDEETWPTFWQFFDNFDFFKFFFDIFWQF